MAIQYLNVTAEEAYSSLAALTTTGYLAWVAIEDRASKALTNTIEELDPLTREDIDKMYKSWINQTYPELMRIYYYKKEALSFLKLRIMGVTYPGQNQYVTDTIGHLEARLNLLTKLTDQLTSRFEINFIAGRDNNIQIGGTGNKQEVVNERQ